MPPEAYSYTVSGGQINYHRTASPRSHLPKLRNDLSLVQQKTASERFFVCRFKLLFTHLASRNDKHVRVLFRASGLLLLTRGQWEMGVRRLLRGFRGMPTQRGCR